MPVLLDGDTGYGNFNNMRRLVRKLEQVGVAGRGGWVNVNDVAAWSTRQASEG